MYVHEHEIFKGNPTSGIKIMERHVKLGKITAILSIISNLLIFFGVVAGVTLAVIYRVTEQITEPWYFVFYYFTVDSNILLGIASAIMVIFSFVSLQTNRIPRWVTNFKYIATVLTTLTMLTVIFVFMILMKAPFLELIKFGSGNLFLHLICPALAIVSLVLVELHNKIRFRQVFVTLIPVTVYGAFYGFGYFLKWEWFKDDPYSFITSFDGNGKYFTPFIALGILFAGAVILWALCQLTSIEDVKKDDEIHEHEKEEISEMEKIDHLIEKDKAKQNKEEAKEEKIVEAKKVVVPAEEKKEIVKEEKAKTEEKPVEKPSPKAKSTSNKAKDTKKETKEPKKEPAKKAPAAKASKPENKETKEEPKEEKPVNKVRTYHISRAKDGDKWQVKLANGAKAIKLFNTQAEAIEYAKGLVDTQGGSIRVHSMKGSIRKV